MGQFRPYVSLITEEFQGPPFPPPGLPDILQKFQKFWGIMSQQVPWVQRKTESCSRLLQCSLQRSECGLSKAKSTL